MVPLRLLRPDPRGQVRLPADRPEIATAAVVSRTDRELAAGDLLEDLLQMRLELRVLAPHLPGEVHLPLPALERLLDEVVGKLRLLDVDLSERVEGEEEVDRRLEIATLLEDARLHDPGILPFALLVVDYAEGVRRAHVEPIDEPAERHGLPAAHLDR